MAGQKVFLRPLMLAVLALAAIAIACGEEEGGGLATPSPAGQPSPAATPGLEASPPAGVERCPQVVPSPAPATENVLANADFEAGRDPWFSLKPPDFEISDVAHAGESSALLRMREPETAQDDKVFYLVQEVLPTEFPDVLSGFYRVENWRKGTEKQYLQFVIIVWGADNAPEDFPNHQIRYILAGIDEEPFAIANAKFVFLSREEPAVGEWVPFQVNVKQDFIDLWGAVPEGYECIRLLYEVRFDDKLPEAPAEADVYYDDLYFGPAQGAASP